MKRRREQSEHDIQKEIVDCVGMMRHRHPEVDLLFAIPNGGLRDAITAAKLKAEGVRPGVPDLCLPVARSCYHALFIEVKRGDAGHQSAPQKAWHRALAEQLFAVCVVRSVSQGVETIRRYLTDPDFLGDLPPEK